jgi:hypothetical protein
MMRWKNEKKVVAWLQRAQARWGLPIRIFVGGHLMAQAVKRDKELFPWEP